MEYLPLNSDVDITFSIAPVDPSGSNFTTSNTAVIFEYPSGGCKLFSVYDITNSSNIEIDAIGVMRCIINTGNEEGRSKIKLCSVAGGVYTPIQTTRTQIVDTSDQIYIIAPVVT